MKLYWRVKINGKWTWRPARTYVYIRPGMQEHLERKNKPAPPWPELLVVREEEFD
jgi:hypothetical protein